MYRNYCLNNSYQSYQMKNVVEKLVLLSSLPFFITINFTEQKTG